jgi:hypothetical protein
MVNRYLIGSLLLLLSASGLDAAPAVLDFSRSHTIEDVRRSGLNFKRLSDLGHSVAYVYEEDRDIVVLLPGGRKISQRITIAHLKEKDGILTHLALHSGVMPQDQAYQVAGMFCDSFNLSHDKLEAWYQLNFGKKYDNKPVNIYADDKYYPAVDLELFPSFSTTYPWSIRFHIEWNWSKQRGRNEEQTRLEFPTPAIPEISLNPPSGLKYDLADDFKPYIASLEAAFGQAKKVKGAPSQISVPGKTVVPPVTAVSKNPTAPVDSGVSWWVWVLGGVVLVLVALWLIWRAYRERP